MPGLLNSSTSSISMDFTDITPLGHTIGISALQFLPSAEGGRKLRGTLVIDQGLGTQIVGTMTLTLRDLVYDEFGLYGNTLSPDAKKKLAVKF